MTFPPIPIPTSTYPSSTLPPPPPYLVASIVRFATHNAALNRHAHRVIVTGTNFQCTAFAADPHRVGCDEALAPATTTCIPPAADRIRGFNLHMQTSNVCRSYHG